MGNLIRADWYRVRKGASLRNTVLGMVFTVALIAFTLYVTGASGSNGQTEAIREQAMSTGGTGIMYVDTEAGVADGGQFVWEILGQNITPFLALPLFVAVFAVDFMNGTYRNTLSFETDRKKVYMAKLLLSFLLVEGLVLGSMLLSFLVGGVLFGFGGMLSAAFLGRTLAILLLTAPLYLGLVSFGNCLVAFTRSTGATIGIYFTVLLVLNGVVSFVGLFLPQFAAVRMIDLVSGISFLAYWWALPVWEIAAHVALGIAVAVVATVVGVRRYQTADMH